MLGYPNSAPGNLDRPTAGTRSRVILTGKVHTSRACSGSGVESDPGRYIGDLPALSACNIDIDSVAGVIVGVDHERCRLDSVAGKDLAVLVLNDNAAGGQRRLRDADYRHVKLIVSDDPFHRLSHIYKTPVAKEDRQ